MNTDLSELIHMFTKQFELQESRHEANSKMQLQQFEKLFNKFSTHSNPVGLPSYQFPSFVPSSEAWSDYMARFITFSEANSIPVDRVPLVFLTNQSSDVFKLLQTTASQLSEPKETNNLSWEEIRSIMSKNFDSFKFIVRERHKFYTEIVRGLNETPKELASRVREKAATCNFQSISDPLDEALKTGFICAINNEMILKAIFHKSSETLKFADVVEIATEVEEASKAASAQMHPCSSEKIYKIKKNYDYNKPVDKYKMGPCFSCGKSGHLRQNCKYRDAICKYCNNKGHTDMACRIKRQSRNKYSRHVHAINQTNRIQSMSKPKIPLIINDKKVHIELDTGSLDNFLSMKTFRTLGKHQLRANTTKYFSANGTEIDTLGIYNAFTLYPGVKSKPTRVDFVITNNDELNILGITGISALKISLDNIIYNPPERSMINTIQDSSLKMDCIKICNKFTHLWKDELGTIKDVELDIRFKENSKPLFCKPRRVPLALQGEIDAALDAGVARGVWMPTDFNDYGTPIVAVRKKGPNGALRVCGDYRATINPYLEDHRQPIPLPDELIAQLGGKYYFSKLDLKDAYNQIKLSPASQKKLALSTQRGVLLQRRLPFGIKSAPGYFQDVITKITKGLKGVVVYFDDILVSGKDRAEHLCNLYEVLKRLDENGVRCNREKCTFAEPTITYLGHTISREGISKGPRAEAIQQMKRPKNVSELRSFMGAIQFYNKFIKNLATIASPLYKLTQNNIQYEWTQLHQTVFEKLKSNLLSDNILAHFDANIPIGIACDASSVGLGVVLFHRYEDLTERPIYYSSKTLTETQTRYSQIHKEALSIIYALSKFHTYLYGRKFIIITDHKPLLSILAPSKDVPILTANRLARWSHILSQYDFTIEYRQTHLHGNADLLSRLPVGPDNEFDNQESENDKQILCHINSITEQISPKNPERIRILTQSDPILSKVVYYLKNKWPDTLHPDLNLFKKIRNYLSIEDDIIVFGNRVVIPCALRAEILQVLHIGHFGMQRMKKLARSSVYWPNINADIVKFARRCLKCSIHSNKLPKAEIHPWDPPKDPWHRIHIDHAINFMGSNWLIVIDAHSKYICVHKTLSISSTTTIRFLENDFSHFGIPYIIVSDNSTSFTSDEFRNWCKSKGITHTTGAPYHPSTNGLAERAVQTFKNSIKKSNLQVDEAVNEFLIQYRRTPFASSNKSPSELLNGRKIRVLIDTFKPKPEDKTRIIQIPCFTGRYKFIVEGKHCLVINNHLSKLFPQKWIRGKIVKILGERHVQVQLQNSNIQVKRHIEQLKPCYTTEQEDYPCYLNYWHRIAKESNNSEAKTEKIPVRKSARIRRPPQRYQPQVFHKRKAKPRRRRC